MEPKNETIMHDDLHITPRRPMMEQLRITSDRIAHIIGDGCGSHRGIVKITTYSTRINDCLPSALEQEPLCNEHFNGECPCNSMVEITAWAELEDRTDQI